MSSCVKLFGALVSTMAEQAGVDQNALREIADSDLRAANAKKHAANIGRVPANSNFLKQGAGPRRCDLNNIKQKFGHKKHLSRT